jgi:hypothetical protein
MAAEEQIKNQSVWKRTLHVLKGGKIADGQDGFLPGVSTMAFIEMENKKKLERVLCILDGKPFTEKPDALDADPTSMVFALVEARRMLVMLDVDDVIVSHAMKSLLKKLAQVEHLFAHRFTKIYGFSIKIGGRKAFTRERQEAVYSVVGEGDAKIAVSFLCEGFTV